MAVLSPSKRKRRSSLPGPSHVTLNTAMSGYAQLLLLCYSCKKAQYHMEDITHPKPDSSFSELSPSIISFCSLPSCKKYRIQWWLWSNDHLLIISLWFIQISRIILRFWRMKQILSLDPDHKDAHVHVRLLLETFISQTAMGENITLRYTSEHRLNTRSRFIM